MILILLGPPGAGKGTQAKLLARDLAVPHISTGDMFRDHKARGTELGKEVEAIMKAGSLVPDEVTNAMVKDRLARPDVAKGFILDGYPRTTAQADFLARLLEAQGRKIDRALSYEVAEGVLVDRLSGRRSCAQCGTVYHLTAHPPKRAGVCDKDGAALLLRDDDKPETVKRRLEEYESKTAPLKRYYQGRNALLSVKGVGSPEEILAASKRLMGIGG